MHTSGQKEHRSVHGVFLFHPGKQHSYRVALALQDAGWLRVFLTGVYYNERELPYYMLQRMPGRLWNKLKMRLASRCQPELDSSLIIGNPFLEIVCRILGGNRFMTEWTEGQSSYAMNNWIGGFLAARKVAHMKPKPAMVYVFLGAALATMEQARRSKIVSVLDVPISLSATRIVAEERQRLGLRARYPNLPARLMREIEIADYFVAPSQTVLDSLTEMGVDAGRIMLVPLGVDIKHFSPRMGKSVNHSFRALFVGKFDLRKGVRYLLEAWRGLAMDNAELRIVGPPGEPGFVAHCLSAYDGLFSWIGNLPHSQLPALYRESDVFVFPSLSEGSALVTYEALASGLPCVVTEEAGSVVRDGVEGLVVPGMDTKALANAIRLLYENEGLRLRMGQAARKRAEEFSWDNYGSRLRKALESTGARMSASEHGTALTR